MTFGERVKSLRSELGLSQEALGAQGFVSTPGWIKIENSQRQASEKLIEKMLKWLVSDKYMKASAIAGLREELLTLKYLGSNSGFVREMAKARARASSNSAVAAAGNTGGAKGKSAALVKAAPAVKVPALRKAAAAKKRK
jgi:transcriptional regulator with XRE-family HTH domain